MLECQNMTSIKTTTEKRRVVAIVGRPNVGKSTIFNRLVGERLAIVHEERGVTRDRLMKETSWNDERFMLIDTGGICSVDGKGHDAINQGIRNQVEAALDDAAVVIHVVDVETGVIDADKDVARLLRARQCIVFVAANKSDNPERDKDTVDFACLGFPVFPVSALHDRGFYDLMKAVVGVLPPADSVENMTPLKVAVVGRPNVGKSSYVNRLLCSERVIVSEIPGTTRDSIDIPFVVGKGEQARHYMLIDTAGIRHTGKIDSSVEMFGRYRAEDSIKRADVVVLVLDTVAKPTAQDKKIADMIMKYGKGCVLVINKWDLADTTQRQYAPVVADMMPFMAHCPIVFTSAKTGFNIRNTVDAIDHVAGQVRVMIPTGVLNRAIIGAWKKVHPPAVKGKDLKVYYVTQVGCLPIRIRLFVNDPQIVTEAYKGYIIRMLRRSFGLEGAPVELQFRARRAPGERGSRHGKC